VFAIPVLEFSYSTRCILEWASYKPEDSGFDNPKDRNQANLQLNLACKP